MDCWICGNFANSGEHKLKASDLKGLFGNISQQKPLFLHTQTKRNLKVGSIKRSDALKSKALLCHNCNTNLTAPYDKAWEILSKHLRSAKGLRKGSVVKISKVFPGSTKTGMLHVHLYFVKLFGCAIKELAIPIDIGPFQKALLSGTAHPKIQISIGVNGSMATGSSDLEMASLNGKPAFATWFYVVGSIAANVMYSESTERRQGLVDSWHPSTISKKVVLRGY